METRRHKKFLNSNLGVSCRSLYASLDDENAGTLHNNNGILQLRPPLNLLISCKKKKKKTQLSYLNSELSF